MTSFLPTLPSIFFSLSFSLSPVADPDLRYGCGGGGHPDPEIMGARSQKFFFRPFGPQFSLKLGGEARASRAPPLDPPLLLVPSSISSFQSSSLPPCFLFPPCLSSVVPPFFPDPSTLSILLSLLPPAISVFTSPLTAIPPPISFPPLFFFFHFFTFILPFSLHSFLFRNFLPVNLASALSFSLLVCLSIESFLFFTGDRSEPVSAEVSFYSRGGSIPSSLKAHITATYLTNTGELSC